MCLRFIVKYTLFFVNLIFTLVGLALVGGGVAAIYLLDDLFTNLQDNIQLNIKFVPYVLIGLGVFIFLVAFCGCCGSVTESKCLLITYAVIMAILAAAKIYLIVELFTQAAYLRERIETIMQDTFEDPALNKTFHALEFFFRCCGTTGPESYDIVINGISYVPPTCCGIENWDDLTNYDCFPETAYQRGCSVLIGDFIQSWSHNIGYILIGIVAVEFLALAFASYISCTIRRKYY